MGVDISGILVKTEKPLSQLPGTFAVDAFNTLYQFLTIIRQPDGTPLMDSQGRITSHLSGLFYRTCNLLEAGVKPVYVFDGTPSELKKQTIAERVQLKVEAEEAFKKAAEDGKQEEMRMYAQRTARLTKEMVSESKKLLELMGLPWVQAPSEGEAQCSLMVNKGLVDAAASQDYDCLLFGASRFVRNMTIAGRRKVPRRNIYTEVMPEEYFLEENLKALEISREKLVWIGVLSGTDFNKGIYGIGAKKALKLVKKHDSLQAILTESKQEADYSEVIDLFMNPPYIEVKNSDLQFRELEIEKIKEFMNEEHDFSLERISSSLAKAFKTPEDSNQSSLKKWF